MELTEGESLEGSAHTPMYNPHILPAIHSTKKLSSANPSTTNPSTHKPSTSKNPPTTKISIPCGGLSLNPAGGNVIRISAPSGWVRLEAFDSGLFRLASFASELVRLASLASELVRMASIEGFGFIV